jgi:hypothetical protein
MSGGYFDYKQYQMQEIIDSIEQLIINNDSQDLDEWGTPISKNYSSETIEQFKIGNTVLKIARIYAQRIDWLVSGDDSESSFIKRLDNDLKLIDNEILGVLFQ